MSCFVEFEPGALQALVGVGRALIAYRTYVEYVGVPAGQARVEFATISTA